MDFQHLQNNSNSPPIDSNSPRSTAEESSTRSAVRGHACSGGAVAEQLADVNENRKGIFIYNTSATKNLFLAASESLSSLSITGGVVSYTVKIPPGGSWSPPGFVKYKGRVWGVFDGALAADEKAMVTEYL